LCVDCGLYFFLDVVEAFGAVGGGGVGVEEDFGELAVGVDRFVVAVLQFAFKCFRGGCGSAGVLLIR